VLQAARGPAPAAKRTTPASSATRLVREHQRKLPSFHYVPGKYVNSKAELAEINRRRAQGENVRPVTVAEQRAMKKRDYQTLAEIEAANKAKLDRINKRAAERKASGKYKVNEHTPPGGRVLTNNAADRAVPHTPTPLEDFEY
jgi:hypothetical protein